VTSNRRFRHDALQKLGGEIFRRGGSEAAEADLVASHLVNANLAGHDSHGVGMIPSYVRHLKAGLVAPNTIQPGNPRAGGTLNSMTAFLVDPARLAGTEWLRREIDGFVTYVKASPPATPGAPVLVPGDPERMAREERLRDGIAVDATTWAEILVAGEHVGLSRSEAERLAAQ
jgi:hydroxycarboxylate dehydrogenase B